MTAASGARRHSPDVRAVLLASVLELASRLRAEELHARALQSAQLEEGAGVQTARATAASSAPRVDVGRALKALASRSSVEKALGDSAPVARSRFALLDQLVYDKARYLNFLWTIHVLQIQLKFMSRTLF